MGSRAAVGKARRPTSTARFGSSRRESHDASAFYDRFVAPDISEDDVVNRPDTVDVIYEHDARDMAMVESDSVALVVTSPPYFAGKEYEESLGTNGVPGTYFEYLALLRDVFAECTRVLEPGGRIAVNVANLGRRPYRSLAGDVTDILQDLGLLLRGEVVWWKGRAAGGSCAWGTFQRPANPVLRDVTERIVIASKGRFDRALQPAERAKRALPSTATISRDEFMEATTDLWEIPPESATRVGHPAPYPVALPERCIHLYTYEDDVVLDPFMGSGTTAVAAVRSGRRYIGFETDGTYAAKARRRIAAETSVVSPVSIPATGPGSRGSRRTAQSAPDAAARNGKTTAKAKAPRPPAASDPLARALREGLQAKDLARIVVESCGFATVREDVRIPRAGVDVSFTADGGSGRLWAFEVAGTFTTARNGLKKTDSLFRALAKAAALHHSGSGMPFVVLTTDMPASGSPGATALDALVGPDGPILDVVNVLDTADRERLLLLRAGAPCKGDGA